MQIGLVGLGRMGANMSRRWLRGGHTVVGYARHAETVNGLVADKAISAGAASLKDLVGQLAAPRVVWLMVPAASVDATLDEIVPLLARGDVVVDGGNSYYVDDIRRSEDPRQEGNPLPRLWHQRRRRRSGARLLPDDRRPGRGREASRPDLPRPGPRRRLGASDTGPRRASRHRPRTATCTAARAAPATS